MSTNVLLICGSLQRMSANRAALDGVRSVLEARDGIEVADASELASIPPFNPDDEADRAPSVIAFQERVAEADAVIISSPEYAGALPGTLKNALDWIVGAAGFYGKPVGLISAGSTGGEHARQQLIRTLSWQGAHIVSHLGIAAPRTKSDESGRFTDSETIEAIGHLASITVDALVLPEEERIALVSAVVSAVGVDPPAIAPVQQR